MPSGFETRDDRLRRADEFRQGPLGQSVTLPQCDHRQRHVGVRKLLLERTYLVNLLNTVKREMAAIEGADR